MTTRRPPMSVLSPPLPPSPFIPTHPVMPLTVDQYHAMIAAGILKPDNHVELLAGMLVPKMPKSNDHRAATGLGRKALEAVIPPNWYVAVQDPITLTDS